MMKSIFLKRYILGVLLFLLSFLNKNLESKPLRKNCKIISTGTRLKILANGLNLVTRTKLLSFNEKLDNAWNGSILEDGSTYLLVFRHANADKRCSTCGHQEQQLKMVYLDGDFNQISSIKTIKSDALYPEDARLHRVNNDFFLTYNDNVDLKHTHPLTVQLYVGKLLPEKNQLVECMPIPSAGIPLKRREKNWTPFVYPEQNGMLHYIYSAKPYNIITFDYINQNGSRSNSRAYNPYSIWQKNIWGEIRGGTPARRVDDVYLTFFHSMRRCPATKKYYYVMGAYIFHKDPPFSIIAITPQPIVFDGMYAADHRSIHNIIYPTGYAIENKDGKTYFHVSCGENDTSIRVVTIEKDALFRSMVQLNSKMR